MSEYDIEPSARSRPAPMFQAEESALLVDMRFGTKLLIADEVQDTLCALKPIVD